MQQQNTKKAEKRQTGEGLRHTKGSVFYTNAAGIFV